MDRNGFIYFNTRLSPKNSGKADSYAWAIMILDEVLPYQDVTDLKENGNQPAEFNVNLFTAFKVDVKVSQSYTNENGGKVGGDVPSLSPALSQDEKRMQVLMQKMQPPVQRLQPRMKRLQVWSQRIKK